MPQYDQHMPHYDQHMPQYNQHMPQYNQQIQQQYNQHMPQYDQYMPQYNQQTQQHGRQLAQQGQPTTSHIQTNSELGQKYSHLSPPVDHCLVCKSRKRVYKALGVKTCHSCFIFFRNAVQEKREFQCKAPKGNCKIIYDSLKCSHCRFQKCLAVGMDKSRVIIRSITNKCLVCGAWYQVSNRHGALVCNPCDQFSRRYVSRD